MNRKSDRPIRCVCGRTPHAHHPSAGHWWIGCELAGCWIGPTGSTEREAVQAWNALMLAAKGEANGKA